MRSFDVVRSHPTRGKVMLNRILSRARGRTPAMWLLLLRGRILSHGACGGGRSGRPGHRRAGRADERPGRRARAPPGRRGQHQAAGPHDGPGALPRVHRAQHPALRPRRLRAWPAVRSAHLHRREEAPGAQGDGRHLGAHLRDLQGLPDPAGQAAAHPRVLHRRRHRLLLLADGPRVLEDPRHPAVLADRHRRQLRRRVVRDPDQHARQLAHGLRQPARASRSRATRSRCAPG